MSYLKFRRSMTLFVPTDFANLRAENSLRSKYSIWMPSAMAEKIHSSRTPKPAFTAMVRRAVMPLKGESRPYLASQSVMHSKHTLLMSTLAWTNTASRM
eukprot:467567-Lingulodinium_polyedra.AAC.1